MQSQFRLQKKYQFNYIYRKGASVSSAEMIMLYAKNNNGKLKVGFSLSKKLGKAVVRNRLKRRYKESFRSLVDKVDHNYNYIFIPRDCGKNIPYAKINQSMTNLLKKTALLIKDN